MHVEQSGYNLGYVGKLLVHQVNPPNFTIRNIFIL